MGGALVRLGDSLARVKIWERRQTSKSTEIGPNFACFWPLKFFWGGSSTEHRAKFHADRPTELGDYAAKKK